MIKKVCLIPGDCVRCISYEHCLKKQKEEESKNGK